MKVLTSDEMKILINTIYHDIRNIIKTQGFYTSMVLYKYDATSGQVNTQIKYQFADKFEQSSDIGNKVNEFLIIKILPTIENSYHHTCSCIILY